MLQQRIKVANIISLFVTITIFEDLQTLQTFVRAFLHCFCLFWKHFSPSRCRRFPPIFVSNAPIFTPEHSVPPTHREVLCVHDQDVLCVHDREVLCVQDREVLCVHDREMLCVQDREVLGVEDREVLCVEDREVPVFPTQHLSEKFPWHPAYTDVF